MAYRYLKITGDWAYGKQVIEKQDLADLKNRGLDMVIDTYEGKYFDKEANEWKEIEGDK